MTSLTEMVTTMPEAEDWAAIKVKLAEAQKDASLRGQVQRLRWAARRAKLAPCRTCGGDCSSPIVCLNFASDWTPTKENS